jgi:hypothetical protein
MNHRAENRILAAETSQATILGHPDVTVPCYIRDFSRSGLCIVVEAAIDSGSIVKVEWDDHFLVGRAQRVSPTGANFRVGLELLYCSKWNDTMESTLNMRNAETEKVPA